MFSISGMQEIIFKTFILLFVFIIFSYYSTKKQKVRKTTIDIEKINSIIKEASSDLEKRFS